MKAIDRILILAVLLMMAGRMGFAAEDAAAPQTEQSPAPAGMDPAMMEKMKTLMAPGETHKVLEAFAGKWTYTGNFKMTPEAQPQEMTGTAENTMIFGGRFLKQEIEGPWMGETFHGLGFTGYDNIKGEYETVWIDSAGTGMYKSSGQYKPETKTLEQSGENSCPLTGEKDRKGRSEWTVTDADHSSYTSYLNGPDGQEFKSMELNYTRAQS